MSPGTTKRWRTFSQALKTIGFFGCVLTFTYSMVWIGYYSAKRPNVPQPERGWTVSISWTHPPVYGTAQEENRLVGLDTWVIPPFLGLLVLGEVIKIYKLRDYSGLKPLRWPFSSKRG